MEALAPHQMFVCVFQGGLGPTVKLVRQWNIDHYVNSNRQLFLTVGCI